MKKGFIAGMLTMLLILSISGTAFALQGKVTQELEYRNISVTLDESTWICATHRETPWNPSCSRAPTICLSAP